MAHSRWQNNSRFAAQLVSGEQLVVMNLGLDYKVNYKECLLGKLVLRQEWAGKQLDPAAYVHAVGSTAALRNYAAQLDRAECEWQKQQGAYAQCVCRAQSMDSPHDRPHGRALPNTIEAAKKRRAEAVGGEQGLAV